MLKPLCMLLLCSHVAVPQAHGTEHYRGISLRIAQTTTDNALTESLPVSVTNAITQDIETRWGDDPRQINIIQAEPRIWSDGCLGLAPPGEFCQEVLVEGWQVTVARDRQQWVYRANNSGSLVFWDQAGSRLDTLFTLQSQPIKRGQRSERLSKKVVLSATTGAASSTTGRETLLLKDGRILQRTDQDKTIATVSPEAVGHLKSVLKQQRFHQFDGLCYLTSGESPNENTIVLRTRKSTVCYTDEELTQLPSALQAVIQAWRQLRPQ